MSDRLSFDPRSFDPRSFDPMSFDPRSFDPGSFEPFIPTPPPRRKNKSPDYHKKEFPAEIYSTKM